MNKSFEVCRLVVLGLFIVCATGFAEHEVGTPRIFAKRFELIPEDSVRLTKNGAKFSGVTVNELSKKLGKQNVEKFGEAWRDPSGMIWGDIVTKEDGSPSFMNHKNAEAYCKRIGGRLPSGYLESQSGKHGFPDKDSDFVRLRKYMGAKDGSIEDYTPEVLPHLTYKKDGKTSSRYIFWSSSVHPDYPSLGAYGFGGLSGDIDSYIRTSTTVFRCVA